MGIMTGMGTRTWWIYTS